MSDSYYGRPVVKAHTWHWYIDAYFWIGGMAGAASVTCVVARVAGCNSLATVQKRAALAGILVSPILLIADLGMPQRFIMMLRVFKVSSPMSVGTWLLSVFGGAIVTSTAAELLGWQRTSRGLEYVAALLGPMLTVYTAVLVADTATPVWHEAYETLPFVFVASGVSAAGAVGAAFAPADERRLARRLMTFGAIALGVAGQVMERRLGSFLAEPYRTGRAGLFKRISGLLGIAGAAVSFAGRENVVTTRSAAACVALAGIFERFAVMAAGKQSANDPKYVVAPQRARLDAREAAGPRMNWRFDPLVVATAAIGLVAYALAVVRYRSLRNRTWPPGRTLWFALGVGSGLFAIESPLDAAGDARFAPHMWQHLILTDVTAPLLLLGAPLLLVLAIAPTREARRIVAALKSRFGRALTFPLVGWSVFILSLWLLHYSGFFEAALDDERLHILEHAIYLGAALLFWFPIVAIGPTPWARGPLAFPLRMLYLFLAMPAEGMLGFSINGARHVLYAHYAAAGIDDQQTAGEIMWIGGTLVMFVAFMLVGYEWAVHEQRLGERMNARLDA